MNTTTQTQNQNEGLLARPEQLNTNKAKGSVYEQITDRIIAMLEQGTVPWRKTWNVKQGFPRNFITGKPYRGINPFLLLSLCYESPYFLTFRQAQELGGSVRRGEKACPVVFWKQLEIEDKDSHEVEKIPMLRFFYVFNLAQIEGIKTEVATVAESMVNTPAESIIANMPNRPEIKFGMTQAFYSPSGDFIGMPNRERFDTENHFYTTLYHEAIHASGSKTRLNRHTLTESDGFGADLYSKEELIAEMGAAFLCGHAGIEATMQNSAAYIQHWLAALQNDKKLIVQAAAQAQKAADFILGTKFEVQG